MSLKIKNILQPLSDSQHNLFLENCTDYSFFQIPDWIRVLISSYPNYQNSTALFQFSDNSNILLPLIRVKKLKGILSTYHSMPFNSYGGFLSPQKIDQEKFSMVWQYLLSLRPVKLSLTPNPLLPGIDSVDSSIKTISMSTQILSLEKGYEWLWENRFDSKNRNQIRKAQKMGLTISSNLPDSGKIYFEIYQNTLEKRKTTKSITYPESLFIQLSLSKEKVKFYFALWNEKPVAGIIVLYGKKSAMYWSAATLPEAKPLCANQLLLDHAIQEATLYKLDFFDFGASRNMPGIQKFKAAFGPEEISYQILEFSRYKR